MISLYTLLNAHCKIFQHTWFHCSKVYEMWKWKKWMLGIGALVWQGKRGNSKSKRVDQSCWSPYEFLVQRRQILGRDGQRSGCLLWRLLCGDWELPTLGGAPKKPGKLKIEIFLFPWILIGIFGSLCDRQLRIAFPRCQMVNWWIHFPMKDFTFWVIYFQSSFRFTYLIFEEGKISYLSLIWVGSGETTE